MNTNIHIYPYIHTYVYIHTNAYRNTSLAPHQALPPLYYFFAAHIANYRAFHAPVDFFLGGGYEGTANWSQRRFTPQNIYIHSTYGAMPNGFLSQHTAIHTAIHTATHTATQCTHCNNVCNIHTATRTATHTATPFAARVGHAE